MSDLCIRSDIQSHEVRGSSVSTHSRIHVYMCLPHMLQLCNNNKSVFTFCPKTKIEYLYIAEFTIVYITRNCHFYCFIIILLLLLKGILILLY